MSAQREHNVNYFDGMLIKSDNLKSVEVDCKMTSCLNFSIIEGGMMLKDIYPQPANCVHELEQYCEYKQQTSNSVTAGDPYPQHS
jgi:hypothetical protein